MDNQIEQGKSLFDEPPLDPNDPSHTQAVRVGTLSGNKLDIGGRKLTYSESM